MPANVSGPDEPEGSPVGALGRGPGIADKDIRSLIVAHLADVSHHANKSHEFGHRDTPTRMRRYDRLVGSGPVVAHTGKRNVARSPRPGRFSRSTAPPCRVATSLTRFRPRPVLFLPVSGRCREKNLSNTRVAA